jgi:hypothetical protein
MKLEVTVQTLTYRHHVSSTAHVENKRQFKNEETNMDMQMVNILCCVVHIHVVLY